MAATGLPNRVVDPFLLAKSRTLAKMALAAAIALVALVLLLPLFIDHATVSEGFFILWGLFLLLAAVILGVALAYVFMTRGLREEGGRPSAAPSTASAAAPDIVLRLLAGDERRLYRRVVEAGGTMLQKDLVGAGPFSGSKVTRLLDRLEAKGLISRERHGMTNRIRLSDGWREKA
jgi:hypothetical protein